MSLWPLLLLRSGILAGPDAGWEGVKFSLMLWFPSSFEDPNFCSWAAQLRSNLPEHFIQVVPISAATSHGGPSNVSKEKFPAGLLARLACLRFPLPWGTMPVPCRCVPVMACVHSYVPWGKYTSSHTGWGEVTIHHLKGNTYMHFCSCLVSQRSLYLFSSR